MMTIAYGIELTFSLLIWIFIAYKMQQTFTLLNT